MRQDAEKAALSVYQQSPEPKRWEGYPDRFTFLWCSSSQCKCSWLRKDNNNFFKKMYGKFDGSISEFSNKSGSAAWQCVQVGKICFVSAFLFLLVCISFIWVATGWPQAGQSQNEMAALPCLNSAAEGKGKQPGDAEHCVIVSAWFRPVTKWRNATRYHFSHIFGERKSIGGRKDRRTNTLSCSWVHFFKKKESKHGIRSKPMKKLKS